LQLRRCPDACRCLLDINGNDHAAKVFTTPWTPNWTACHVIWQQNREKSARPHQTMLNKEAEVLADVHDRLVEEAVRRFTMDLDEEVNRLKARNINPTVRPGNPDAGKHKAEGRSVVAEPGKIRLDAIRVLVVG
jgi:antitoxin component of MazEF toxin-antitoxin module